MNNDYERRVRNLERAIIALQALIEDSLILPDKEASTAMLFDFFSATTAEDKMFLRPDFEQPEGRDDSN